MGAWSNIQRAIDTSMAAGEAVVGLQIAVGVMALRAPFLIGSLPEIRGRIEQTLAATQASEHQLTELQLAAMAMIAWLAVLPGASSGRRGALGTLCCCVRCTGGPRGALA